MIARIIPVLIFAAGAVILIQLINRSFTYTYTSVKTSLENQYGAAFTIYDAEVTSYDSAR